MERKKERNEELIAINVVRKGGGISVFPNLGAIKRRRRLISTN